jgi:hypothetical protein
MKIRNTLYYIFIYPILYIISGVIIYLFQLYLTVGRKRDLKKVCKNNGHLWNYHKGCSQIAYHRNCNRCNKKQWLNINNQTWND